MLTHLLLEHGAEVSAELGVVHSPAFGQPQDLFGAHNAETLTSLNDPLMNDLQALHGCGP